MFLRWLCLEPLILSGWFPADVLVSSRFLRVDVLLSSISVENTSFVVRPGGLFVLWVFFVVFFYFRLLLVSRLVRGRITWMHLV